MTITLVSGATTTTLIAGASRTAQQIAGPVDEQSLEDALQVQIKRPLRAAAATPLSRGNILATLRFSGIRLDTTEDLSREWAWTWPYTCPRAGTLYITGATRRVVCATAVIQSMVTRANGCSARVDYVIACGAITAENNPS